MMMATPSSTRLKQYSFEDDHAGRTGSTRRLSKTRLEGIPHIIDAPPILATNLSCLDLDTREEESHHYQQQLFRAPPAQGATSDRQFRVRVITQALPARRHAAAAG